MRMDAYRKILIRTGNIFLLVVLAAAAVTGMITYPAVAVLGSGFDEGRLVTTLSMMLAGLCAEGTTEITELHHIDRGYENPEEILRFLGADIKRMKADETN